MPAVSSARHSAPRFSRLIAFMSAQPFAAPSVNIVALASTNWTAATSLARVTRSLSIDTRRFAAIADAGSEIDASRASSVSAYDWSPTGAVTVRVRPVGMVRGGRAPVVSSVGRVVGPVVWPGVAATGDAIGEALSRAPDGDAGA